MQPLLTNQTLFFHVASRKESIWPTPTLYGLTAEAFMITQHTACLSPTILHACVCSLSGTSWCLSSDRLWVQPLYHFSEPGPCLPYTVGHYSYYLCLISALTHLQLEYTFLKRNQLCVIFTILLSASRLARSISLMITTAAEFKHWKMFKTSETSL